MGDNMPQLRADLAQVATKARLTAAAHDMDAVLESLVAARAQVAAARDPHMASLILAKLQNPVKEGFDKVNDDLKAATKTHKEFGRTLDRLFPAVALPTGDDVMAAHRPLINQAIAMHLLRRGHFDVAKTFLDESNESSGSNESSESRPQAQAQAADTYDLLMGNMPGTDPDLDTNRAANLRIRSLGLAETTHLQNRFRELYSILQDIKAHNLQSAIDWARRNETRLASRSSCLEFELCKLQFLWLTKPRNQQRHVDEDDYDDDEDDENVVECGSGYGVGAMPSATTDNLGPAFEYARANFYRFSDRHALEIQRLSAALVYASNIGESPYACAFDTATAFDDMAAAFTREFCWTLGLSAESPLYAAATAGAIALPRLCKFTSATRGSRTAWSTEAELAFETPLPASMMYHPIFVCPVSKEQSTESNPPMRLPCGHVLARESLMRHAMRHRFKCPYCPVEAVVKECKRIYL